MKRLLSLPFFAIAFMIAGCASSGSSSDSGGSTALWVNKEKAQGKTFKNIFIVVLTADIEARVKLENDLATLAVSKGYKALKSLDVMAFNLNDPKIPAKEEIVAKVKASGCDAVFVASLLRKDEEIRYIPGKTSYSITPYTNWSGNYFGYYSNYYESVSRRDYYNLEQSYFILSNLYDVASEEIMLSAQSDLFNPSNLADFSKRYIRGLMKQLEEEKLLKK